MTEFEKVLAIDFGIRRVGVALSYGTLAEPLEIIANDEQLFERIVALIAEHGVQKIVVGISESKTAQLTMQFVIALEKQVAVPVVLADETLSTQQARRKLIERGATGFQADKARVDHFAAAEILQEWLDSQ